MEKKCLVSDIVVKPYKHKREGVVLGEGHEVSWKYRRGIEKYFGFYGVGNCQGFDVFCESEPRKILGRPNNYKDMMEFTHALAVTRAKALARKTGDENNYKDCSLS